MPLSFIFAIRVLRALSPDDGSLYFFLIFEFYFIYFFIQQVLISYPFYTYISQSQSPNSDDGSL